MANRGLARYAWIVLAYTVLVILFGAFVRAGLHGDGCGAHWPGCNGALIPTGTSLNESIEFGHRLSSALLGFLVFGLVAWAFVETPKRHPARRASLFVLFFTITEAAIGAALVLAGHAVDVHVVEWGGVLVLVIGGVTEHLHLRQQRPSALVVST